MASRLRAGKKRKKDAKKTEGFSTRNAREGSTAAAQHGARWDRDQKRGACGDTIEEDRTQSVLRRREGEDTYRRERDRRADQHPLSSSSPGRSEEVEEDDIIRSLRGSALSGSHHPFFPNQIQPPRQVRLSWAPSRASASLVETGIDLGPHPASTLRRIESLPEPVWTKADLLFGIDGGNGNATELMQVLGSEMPTATVKSTLRNALYKYVHDEADKYRPPGSSWSFFDSNRAPPKISYMGSVKSLLHFQHRIQLNARASAKQRQSTKRKNGRTEGENERERESGEAETRGEERRKEEKERKLMERKDTHYAEDDDERFSSHGTYAKNIHKDQNDIQNEFRHERRKMGTAVVGEEDEGERGNEKEKLPKEVKDGSSSHHLTKGAISDHKQTKEEEKEEVGPRKLTDNETYKKENKNGKTRSFSPHPFFSSQAQFESYIDNQRPSEKKHRREMILKTTDEGKQNEFQPITSVDIKRILKKEPVSLSHGMNEDDVLPLPSFPPPSLLSSGLPSSSLPVHNVTSSSNHSSNDRNARTMLGVRTERETLEGEMLLTDGAGSGVERDKEIILGDEVGSNLGSEKNGEVIGIGLGMGMMEDDPVPLNADVQSRLRRLFSELRMDPRSRLRLVIKYTIPRYARKLGFMLFLWEAAAQSILQRERYLQGVVRRFEKKSSDPTRLLLSSSSTYNHPRRLTREVQKRKRIQERLDEFTKDCERKCVALKEHFGDMITYDGRSYLEKMKTDQSELLFALERERLECERKSRQ